MSEHEQSEQFFQCPYCWQGISMLLDLSIDEQTFVEDCEVCCHPIQVHYRVEEGAVAELAIEKMT